VRTNRLEPQPLVERGEHRLTTLHPFLHRERVMRLAQRTELRLHARQLALQCLDGRVDIFRPRASQLGQQRGLQA
jgi:hypothetical protein